jgi:hypothetical protein
VPRMKSAVVVAVALIAGGTCYGQNCHGGYPPAAYGQYGATGYSPWQAPPAWSPPPSGYQPSYYPPPAYGGGYPGGYAQWQAPPAWSPPPAYYGGYSQPYFQEANYQRPFQAAPSSQSFYCVGGRCYPAGAGVNVP